MDPEFPVTATSSNVGFLELAMNTASLAIVAFASTV